MCAQLVDIEDAMKCTHCGECVEEAKRMRVNDKPLDVRRTGRSALF